MCSDYTVRNSNYIEQKHKESLESLTVFPRYFLIETVFACNARCIMCPAERSARRRGKMKKELIYKLLDEISLYRDVVKKVQFYLHGEPCLDKSLPLWIAEAKKRGITTTHTATNGSLLNEDMSKGLIKAGLDQIYIAIDGATNETYSAIRKGLDLTVVKQNVLRFLELRNEINPQLKVRILMVAQPLNLHEVEEWRQFWEPKLSEYDELKAIKILNWGGQVDTGEFYKPQDDTIPCICLFSTLAVMADGTVPLCCEDVMPTYSLGDINRASVADIWQSSRWKDIRQLHLEGKRAGMALCKGCDIWREDKYYAYKQ